MLQCYPIYYCCEQQTVQTFIQNSIQLKIQVVAVILQNSQPKKN